MLLEEISRILNLNILKEYPGYIKRYFFNGQHFDHKLEGDLKIIRVLRQLALLTQIILLIKSLIIKSIKVKSDPHDRPYLLH